MFNHKTLKSIYPYSEKRLTECGIAKCEDMLNSYVELSTADYVGQWLAQEILCPVCKLYKRSEIGLSVNATVNPIYVCSCYDYEIADINPDYEMTELILSNREMDDMVDRGLCNE